MAELFDELLLVLDDVAVVLERLDDPGVVVPALLRHAEELGTESAARASARYILQLMVPFEVFDGSRW